MRECSMCGGYMYPDCLIDGGGDFGDEIEQIWVCEDCGAEEYEVVSAHEDSELDPDEIVHDQEFSPLYEPPDNLGDDIPF